MSQTLVEPPVQLAVAVPSAPTLSPALSPSLADPVHRPDRYHVSVEEYVRFKTDGFLVVKNVLTPAEVAELVRHTEDLMQGRLPEQSRVMQYDALGKPIHGTQVQELEAPPANLSPEQKAEFWLRIHMLHRKLQLHERYLLHPRVLDVLEALIGPDVLAMQTMLFLKGPGKPGQGFHQDSYYIPTQPDSLCGAWIAVDDCDEDNGCMFFTKGSQNEPVYPPADGYGFGDKNLKEIKFVHGVSDTDDSKNDLVKIAAKYAGREVAVPAKAGDVVFFGGHVLHRSHTNQSKTRFRRSFVGHYCNARSFTAWGADDHPGLGECTSDPLTGSTNGSHILARGDTHMPFAKPRFGTPCAALLPAEQRRAKDAGQISMMGMPDGKMAANSHGTDEDHDRAHAAEEAAQK